MMGSDFYFRDKIPVAVLGVTEKNGIILIQKISHHPWFALVALCDERCIGEFYKEVIPEAANLPETLQELIVQPPLPPTPCSLVFSCLSSPNAHAIEKSWARGNCCVVSSQEFQDEIEALLLHAELLVKEGRVYW